MTHLPQDDGERLLGAVVSTATMSYTEAVAKARERDGADKYSESTPVEVGPGSWRVATRLRSNWRELCVSERVDRPVRRGERFAVVSDTEARVLTHWRGPATGGGRARLARGTVLVADQDQSPDAPGFSLVPEDYERLETALVGSGDRHAEGYSGYSLSFVLDDIGPRLRALDD